jgi:GH43 family beta-xylosidase
MDAMSAGSFRNPIPGFVLGDPFVLAVGRAFYLYGTNDGPPLPDGRVVPVYRSADLLSWEFLGGALEPRQPGADVWAPEVLRANGRYYMVVSFGDVDRQGHALWVATADRPEGPFSWAKPISDPAERFSIDGAWLRDDDGRLYLYRCLDFVEDAQPPHGTGIVVQPMRDPLTPDGPPRTVLRAHSPWHLFEADRPMPLYGGRRFAEWTTIEGPAPVRRAGRVFCGYSGGNYQFAYGTGEAVADVPLGLYTDLRGREGPLFGTIPGLVDGPGHFSVVQPDRLNDWIVLHGRTPGGPGRQVWLCPVRWDRDGVQIPPLSTEPQPRPRVLSPLISDRDTLGTGWSREGDDLVHRGDETGETIVAVRLAGDWAVEMGTQLPETPRALTLLHVDFGEASGIGLWLDFFPGRTVRVVTPGSRPVSVSLPGLGAEPFRAEAVQPLLIRKRRGILEVRLDGVVLAALPVDEGTTAEGLRLGARGDLILRDAGVAIEGARG